MLLLSIGEAQGRKKKERDIESGSEALVKTTKAVGGASKKEGTGSEGKKKNQKPKKKGVSSEDGLEEVQQERGRLCVDEPFLKYLHFDANHGSTTYKDCEWVGEFPHERCELEVSPSTRIEPVKLKDKCPSSCGLCPEVLLEAETDEERNAEITAGDLSAAELKELEREKRQKRNEKKKRKGRKPCPCPDEEEQSDTPTEAPISGLDTSSPTLSPVSAPVSVPFPTLTPTSQVATREPTSFPTFGDTTYSPTVSTSSTSTSTSTGSGTLYGTFSGTLYGTFSGTLSGSSSTSFPNTSTLSSSTDNGAVAAVIDGQQSSVSGSNNRRLAIILSVVPLMLLLLIFFCLLRMMKKRKNKVVDVDDTPYPIHKTKSAESGTSRFFRVLSNFNGRQDHERTDVHRCSSALCHTCDPSIPHRVMSVDSYKDEYTIVKPAEGERYRVDEIGYRVDEVEC